MALLALSRLFVAPRRRTRLARAAQRVVESRPPRSRPSRLGRWLGTDAWAQSALDWPDFGRRARAEALALARLDFADALYDVRTAASAGVLERVAIARSLHELWHLRDAVFGHVALKHGQTEAAARLVTLDRHFPQRIRRRRLLSF